MYKYFNRLIGNDQTLNYFRENIEKKSLPHAFIIEGENGTGKHTLVNEIAQIYAIFSGADFEMLNRIKNNISPDIITQTFVDNKKTIGIECIRTIRNTLFLHPNELEFKFYIIEHAQTMTIPAQNAALKILEEPPVQNYFFILTTSQTPLLPTVRSRCATIRMQIPEKEEIRNYLLSFPSYAKIAKTDLQKFEESIEFAYSKGSLGLGIDYLNSKKTTAKSENIDLFDAIEMNEYTTFLMKMKSEREFVQSQIELTMNKINFRERGEEKEAGDKIRLYDALANANVMLKENANIGVVKTILIDKINQIKN